MTLHSDLIFDIGLHRGEDTEFYLKKGFKVIAFEADPDLVARCKTRFRRAIECGRLQIIEGAIAPESAGKHVRFYRNVQKSVWGTVDEQWVKRNTNLFGTESVRIDVERIDIAHAFRTYGIPFYVKVDIEGMDHLVAETLRHFNERPPYISIEAEILDCARLFADLRDLYELGYRRFNPVQQAHIPGSRIKTRSLNGKPFEHVFEPSASGPFGEDLPGPWLSYAECLDRYQGIAKEYRMFGPESFLCRLPGGRHIVRVLGYLRGRTLTGWYDTHASLS